MASVVSKTSLKIDDLIEGTVITGSISSNGHLILTTRGGADIDAGLVTKPFGGGWDPSTSYEAGDIVGYSGTLWKASAANIGKPPALFTSVWTSLTGESFDGWVEKDPFFAGDSLNSWDFSIKTGTPVASLTTAVGEFETGKQALKLNIPGSASQTFFAKDETIIRGGETITVSVRAKMITAANTITLTAKLLQNDATDKPNPGAGGVVSTAPVEVSYLPGTTWATYTFTFTATNAKPRASIAITASASATATIAFDRVRVTRQRPAARVPYTNDYRANDITIPASTMTMLTFGTTKQPRVDITWDSTNLWYVIPKDGLYVMCVSVCFDNVNTTGSRQVNLIINGVQANGYGALIPGNASADLVVTLTAVHRFVSGENVAVGVYQNSGVNVTVLGDQFRTYFQMYRIGD